MQLKILKHIIIALFLLQVSISKPLVAEPTTYEKDQESQKRYSEESSTLDHIIFPLVTSFALELIFEASAAKATKWTMKDEQLGVSLYRTFRCLYLGLHGLSVYWNYSTTGTPPENHSNTTQLQIMQEKNQVMLGYLAADAATMLLSNYGIFFDKLPLRKELLVHHLMGLAAWGYSFSTNSLVELFNANLAVELLSALKIFEYVLAHPEIIGSYKEMLTLTQRRGGIQLCMLYRLGIILIVRSPIWYLDWKSTDQYEEQLGTNYFIMYRLLNYGIIGLEGYWAYKVLEKFRHPITIKPKEH